MVTIEVKALNGIEKIKGLIFSGKASPVLIKTRFGIHTFGLKFPIDVLVLDRSNKVAIIKKGLRPNRIFIWNPSYDRVIELPKGEITNLRIKRKDILLLKQKQNS